MPDRMPPDLRRTCKQIRENLPISYQEYASSKIVSHIKTLCEFAHAKRIALYRAVKGEINLDELWNTASLCNKHCYFPILNADKTLSFLPATPATPFKKNRFGIAEPLVDKELAILPEQLDMMFVPLLAFDEYCNRIGMGGGYYDRTLEKSRPQLIGVAYPFQQYPSLSPQPWDIPLDIIITPTTLFRSKK